jgi:hypothetical protein
MVIPGNEPFLMSHRGLTALAIILCWVLIGGPAFLKSNMGIYLISLLIGFELLWFLSIQVTGLEWLGTDRYGIAVLPIFYLILAGGEHTRKDKLKNIRHYSVLTIIAAFAIIPLTWKSIEDFYPLEKGGDWSRVSNYIKENETTNQPIVVFRNEGAYSFKYHYSGVNKIIPFPKELSFESFNPKDFAVFSLDEVANTFSKHIEEDSHVWIVTDEVYSYRGVIFGHDYFEAFLESNTNILSDKVFQGSSVRLVRYIPRK